jgi:hypothetical protein
VTLTFQANTVGAPASERLNVQGLNTLSGCGGTGGAGGAGAAGGAGRDGSDGAGDTTAAAGPSSPPQPADLATACNGSSSCGRRRASPSSSTAGLPVYSAARARWLALRPPERARSGTAGRAGQRRAR